MNHRTVALKGMLIEEDGLEEVSGEKMDIDDGKGDCFLKISRSHINPE